MVSLLATTTLCLLPATPSDRPESPKPPPFKVHHPPTTLANPPSHASRALDDPARAWCTCKGITGKWSGVGRVPRERAPGPPRRANPAQRGEAAATTSRASRLCAESLVRCSGGGNARARAASSRDGGLASRLDGVHQARALMSARTTTSGSYVVPRSSSADETLVSVLPAAFVPDVLPLRLLPPPLFDSPNRTPTAP